MSLIFYSLRFRLVCGSLLIVLLTLGAAGFLSTKVSNREFQRYVNTSGTTDLNRFAEPLREHYKREKQWAGVQPVLDRIGNIAGKRFILTDLEGRTIAAFPRELLHSGLQVSPDGTVAWESKVDDHGTVLVDAIQLKGVPHLEILDDSKHRIGILYATELIPQHEKDKAQFFVSVNHGVLISILIAASLALILNFALSERLLRPIRQLTRATREMQKGNLQQRVPVKTRDETGELAKAFNSMAESLERAEEMRRNMTNDIAHELRTPLTNIRCQLESLQDGLLKPDSTIINSLHEEAMLLGRIVDDLQDLALADAGRLRLSRHPMAIGREIQNAVHALEPVLSSKRIEIKVGLQPDIPLIYADARRIGQTLRNLLSNAVAHTSSGGRIEIRAHQGAGKIEVSISDTGEGIAAFDLPFIFDRFYRADHSRARTTGGAGLGLAIVKQLVQSHGGQISAESEPGRGTTILFTLPVS